MTCCVLGFVRAGAYPAGSSCSGRQESLSSSARNSASRGSVFVGVGATAACATVEAPWRLAHALLWLSLSTQSGPPHGGGVSIHRLPSTAALLAGTIFGEANTTVRPVVRKPKSPEQESPCCSIVQVYAAPCFCLY